MEQLTQMKRRSFVKSAISALAALVGLSSKPKVVVANETEESWAPKHAHIYTFDPLKDGKVVSICQFHGELYIACEYSVYKCEGDTCNAVVS